MRRSILATGALMMVIMAGGAFAEQAGPALGRGAKPMPEGRQIEAHDGDMIVVDGDARIRFLRRRNAVVRIIFNPTDRWAVVLADFVPANGSADGYVDYTYNWRGIEGTWPIDERWEGAAFVEEYQAPAFAPTGIGVVLPQGRLQFIGGGPARDTAGFKDPQALAVLSHKGSGSGGGGRETFEQAELRMVASMAANARDGSGSVSTFSGPGGISGAVSFGVVSGGVRSDQDANGPVRVGGSIPMPRKIHDVAPVYPDSMRQSGVGGVVILELVIGADGSVTSAKVLRGQLPEIDRAALDTARQWRYEPVLLNGVAVPVILTATVNVRP